MHKIMTAVLAGTFVAASSMAFAQSAGTSATGTSGGQQGTPPSAATGSSSSSMSSGSGATQMAKPGDTTGNSGALGKETAQQHEKLGN